MGDVTPVRHAAVDRKPDSNDDSTQAADLADEVSGNDALLLTGGETPGPVTDSGERAELVDQAAAWQGNDRYPGVDSWRTGDVQPGDILYQMSPGYSSFFVTQEAVEATGLDARELNEGLQIAPLDDSYRPGITAYTVTDASAAAICEAQANPQYGDGGLTQVYLPNWRDVTEPQVTLLLDNCQARKE